MKAVLLTFLFLVFNVVVLQAIAWLKLHYRGPNRKHKDLQAPTVPQRLDAEHILEWEYEYIRHTASEAMQDRHTMVNFYLVLVGVVASGVLANLDKLLKNWDGAATFILWAVCGVGWFHFLILVRLREAWHESLRAMLDLRDFYVRYANGFSSKVLMEAFRWRQESLPSAKRPWSVFFYSAMLIGLLDSIAFGVGGHLLSVGWCTVTWTTSASLAVLSAAFFAYHMWVYSALLPEKP